MPATVLTRISRRSVNLAGFTACAALLVYAYYLQFSEGLDPCPLCIFQRVAFLAMGLVFLIAAIHNPGRSGGRLYAILLALTGIAGTAIAGRHVWLQHLPPDQVPECGPGLEYMLEVFPLSDALRMAFTGSGECASVDWVFLGLSMPAWALVCFLGLTLAGVIRNWLADQ